MLALFVFVYASIELRVLFGKGAVNAHVGAARSSAGGLQPLCRFA